MPERRTFQRPDWSDRRSFPRPPYWLNLALILLGVAGILLGRTHRERVSERFAHVIQEEARTPDDFRRIKEELAEMDLTRDQLQAEVRARRRMLSSLRSENFHIAIDTRARLLRFMYGDTVLREAPVTPGEHRTIQSGTRRWTFVPLKGAFTVDGKLVGHDWQVPEWVYAMRGVAPPSTRPSVRDGLGKYVILLPNGYVIHSPPAPGSPLTGPKPGSYMVPEEDLRAIWPRITRGKTEVYIF